MGCYTSLLVSRVLSVYEGKGLCFRTWRGVDLKGNDACHNMNPSIGSVQRFREPPFGSGMKQDARTSWENPVWDLLRLAGVCAQLPGAVLFAYESLSCQLPSEATQRSPTEGDRRSNSLPATLRNTGKNSGGDLILRGGE